MTAIEQSEMYQKYIYRQLALKWHFALWSADFEGKKLLEDKHLQRLEISKADKNQFIQQMILAVDWKQRLWGLFV